MHIGHWQHLLVPPPFCASPLFQNHPLCTSHRTSMGSTCACWRPFPRKILFHQIALWKCMALFSEHAVHRASTPKGAMHHPSRQLSHSSKKRKRRPIPVLSPSVTCQSVGGTTGRGQTDMVTVAIFSDQMSYGLGRCLNSWVKLAGR